MSRRHLAATFALTGVALGALTALSAAAPAAASGPSTVSGVLEVLHEDHLDQGRSVHHYRLVGSDGSRTELLFDDRGPEGLGARSVRVTGTQVRPGVLRVGSSSAVQEAGGGSTGTGGTAQAETTTVPTKKVAVILLDFAGSKDTDRWLAPAQAGAVVFGSDQAPSVNSFLDQTSFSQLALTGAATTAGDVFGWVRIGASSTDACDYNAWGTQARSLAADAGFVDAAYDQVIHLMPASTCRFGGVAYMPGKYSWTVLRSADDPAAVDALRRVTSHEYGHNLGIHHAGSYRCTQNGVPVALSTNAADCALAEYGDPFSVLGMSPAERQYHGYQKGRVAWVAGAATRDVTATSTHSLSSVSLPATLHPQVLRVARPRSKGSTDYLYIELRQPTGDFDDFDAASAVVKGLTLRIAPDYGVNAVSKLLDTTPGSITAEADRATGYGGDFEDAALGVGRTFTDPANGVGVTLHGITDGVAQVSVTFPTTQTKGGGGGKK